MKAGWPKKSRFPFGSGFLHKLFFGWLYTSPCASIESATLTKPPMLAPLK